MLSTRWLVCTLSMGLCVGLAGTASARSPAFAPALWGPPVLCHPIAFAEGEVPSLPFGDDAFDTKWFFDRDTVVDLTIGAIDARHDTFFHMETLRRGMIYLAWGDNPKTKEIERLVLTLEGRVKAAQRALEAAPEEHQVVARRALGLAAFDLAWTLEGLSESRHGRNPRSSKARDAALELALAHCADDAAVQLGAAILGFMRNDEQALYHHLGRALQDVEDESCLLARNVNNTIGPFMSVRGTRALVALCEQKSKST
ncbi:MAG: hypothetical protein DRQ55_05940 [Planctomycetota bacterium]|nr:MAG: hypothetical protein DRQ55_05940 [Planctomycetota bacterium]